MFDAFSFILYTYDCWPSGNRHKAFSRSFGEGLSHLYSKEKPKNKVYCIIKYGGRSP